MNGPCSFFLFLFSLSPHLHPSSLSPAHFLKLQNCCSAVGSQLRLSTANSLIKNSVSGPIQALKAPLNGFSCRVPSLETINIHIHTLHAVISTPIVEIIQLQSHFFSFSFLFFIIKGLSAHKNTCLLLSLTFLSTQASVNTLLLDSSLCACRM